MSSLVPSPQQTKHPWRDPLYHHVTADGLWFGIVEIRFEVCVERNALEQARIGRRVLIVACVIEKQNRVNRLRDRGSLAECAIDPAVYERVGADFLAIFLKAFGPTSGDEPDREIDCYLSCLRALQVLEQALNQLYVAACVRGIEL